MFIHGPKIAGDSAALARTLISLGTSYFTVDASPMSDGRAMSDMRHGDGSGHRFTVRERTLFASSTPSGTWPHWPTPRSMGVSASRSIVYWP